MTLTAPASGARWAGAEAVTWTTTRADGDVVEVWVNRTDDAAGWQKLGEAPVADGHVRRRHRTVADAALARVRLFVRTPDGRIVGRDTSAPFALDNPGNAAPELRLDDEALRFDPRLTGDTYDLPFVAADAENDGLTGRGVLQRRRRQTYTSLGARETSSSAAPQSVPVDLAALPNSRPARFRRRPERRHVVRSTAETVLVPQADPARRRREVVQPVQGEGEGSVELRVVDQSGADGPPVPASPSTTRATTRRTR